MAHPLFNSLRLISGSLFLNQKLLNYSYQHSSRRQIKNIGFKAGPLTEIKERISHINWFQFTEGQKRWKDDGNAGKR